MQHTPSNPEVNPSEKPTDESSNKQYSIKQLSRILAKLIVETRDFMLKVLDIRGEIDEEGTKQGIRKEINFTGHNAWILIFAIFLASVGLNTNSTAVIIGAMLVSPLMGPIVGIGLAVGINDFPMLKRSVKNLGIAVAISVITSALYFAVTPLSEAQSELLARTQPTIFDVLIATFGGLAGIVAGSRKEKSNVIPGVAIATALMPPLCTAGYGLGTGQWPFFLGAFYLFFINSVFISLSTFVVVRLLNFEKEHLVDPRSERKVRIYITAFAIITLVPSVYLGWRVVQQAVFKTNVQRFLAENTNFKESYVIDSKSSYYNADSSVIEITLMGEGLKSEQMEALKEKLPVYGLAGTSLIIRQSQGFNAEIEQELNQKLRVGIIEDLYKRNEELIKDKDKKIGLLETELAKYKRTDIRTPQITKELKVLYKNLESFAYYDAIVANANTGKIDTIPTVIIRGTGFYNPQDLKQLLKVRLEKDTLQVIYY
ncbi:DUF389 domain-containing protein [Eisenibacter elegans]|uniref:DUF389 domain-containing protein n=1 Tax=Eisenibacter elegans TaxID=997 RepID=UPI0003F5DDD7|nr:DUF389 domain-containing protein [Eisenibacter elegans]